MGIRLQSSSVGKSLKRLLDLHNSPDSLNLLPATLPVVIVPDWQPYSCQGELVGVNASGTKTFITVPSDEEWILHCIDARVTVGTGTIDAMWVSIDKRFCSPKNASNPSIFLPLIGFVSSATVVSGFYSPLPLPPNSVIQCTYTHTADVSVLTFKGLVMRRKW